MLLIFIVMYGFHLKPPLTRFSKHMNCTVISFVLIGWGNRFSEKDGQEKGGGMAVLLQAEGTVGRFYLPKEVETVLINKAYKFLICLPVFCKKKVQSIAVYKFVYTA